MMEKLHHRYRVAVKPTEDIEAVEHRLNDLGFKTVSKRPEVKSMDIEGPQSAKTALSRVPGVEYVVYIHVHKNAD